MKRYKMAVKEAVGNSSCPTLIRTALAIGGYSLRLHRFAPGHVDSHHHDHPWSFVTIVVSGTYEDVARSGRVDRLTPGSVRFRRSDHAHVVNVGPSGCTTVVLTGRIRNNWGFWVRGCFYDATRYRALFPPPACTPGPDRRVAPDGPPVLDLLFPGEPSP